MLGTSSWQLRDGDQIVACNRSLLGHRHFLIGITRVRNEALILRDTLDYVGKHVDAIVAYVDASTDRTLEILGAPKSRSDYDKSVVGSGHRGTSCDRLVEKLTPSFSRRVPQYFWAKRSTRSANAKP
jgi:hypothetical protein